MTATILIGDCRETLKSLADASVDSVVCDPPYHLTSIVKRWSSGNARLPKTEQTGVYARTTKGFMGQTWDGGDVAFQPETWVEVLRVLKPGGHMVAFSGTRTYHRMVCAIEDAGFEIRDQLAWVYGSGFPKSHDVSKQIDKAAGKKGTFGEAKSAAHQGWIDRGRMRGEEGHEGYQRPWMKDEEAVANNARQYLPATGAAQQWQGWGTALKPSWEPICLARKPLIGTVAANVLAHGTGALNIDGCRIGTEESDDSRRVRVTNHRMTSKGKPGGAYGSGGYPLGDQTIACGGNEGRWPANLCHDGSEEVLARFPETESGSIAPGTFHGDFGKHGRLGKAAGYENPGFSANSGSAARFFYCAKATTDERGEGNNHPTVKPQALMQWLVRLVTPKGGTVLDPFMGSGSTLIAADAEQFNAIGCELSEAYAAIAEQRIREAAGMFAQVEIVPPSIEEAA